MLNIKTIDLIEIFTSLGQKLSHHDEQLSAIIAAEHNYNAWFTPQSVGEAVAAIGKMLNKADLEKWLSRYRVNENEEPKKIGLILAGNIPLVGFHDILSVLASGHHALIKLSSQDTRLTRYILKLLTEIEPTLADRFTIVERLENFDAVIATGSNNTSRYFEYYFGKVPHIIRKNRNSVAVLSGNETAEQLYRLGHDIFDYFGLGCRNVSKLLVPNGYDFTKFFESIESHHPIIHHYKYHNNYDYNKAIYLVNKEKHLDNGFLLLKEDEKLASPLAVLYFETYSDVNSVEQKLGAQQENIQCVVSVLPLKVNNQLVDFGESQSPKLWDYADGVDTMEFLSNL
jgi:hypothetical protein